MFKRKAPFLLNRSRGSRRMSLKMDVQSSKYHEINIGSSYPSDIEIDTSDSDVGTESNDYHAFSKESKFEFVHMEEDDSDDFMDSEVDYELSDVAELVDCYDFDFDVFAYIKTLDFKLRKWAVRNNIRLFALTELLAILKESGHSSLPKDARTLLKTPKKVEVSKMGSGEYWYGGLQKKLTEICKTMDCPNVLKLKIHIDGTPVYKSSKSEFWPVQCDIRGVQMKSFFVAIYSGHSKPPTAEIFLRPLLNEIHSLTEKGLSVTMNGKTRTFNIGIDSFILDAPARAFCKCIIGHSGYYSCERCEEPGIYLCKVPKNANLQKKKKSGHVCLIGTHAKLRTDESFRNQENDEHHHDSSPLEELDIDMVRDIPLEYLHLILYGAMKRLLILWVDGTNNFKFSASDIKAISQMLEKLGETKPSEINRKNRSVNCLSFWKATEFRTFLLKTGPVVLQHHLSPEMYNHFLALHCAVTICCSESLKKYLPAAVKLFRMFTEKFGSLYGDENYTYSLHSLIHVPDDVKRFGVLDNYSAFPGESNLGFLKSLVRGGHLPLQQVIRRIAERDSLEKICEFVDQEIKEDGLSKGILRMNGLRLDSSEKNRWILTKNREIFKIDHFCEEENIKIYGSTLLKENRENLYDVPIASSNLDIYLSTLESIPSSLNLDDMFCKLYRVEVNAEKSAFFPLYHYTQ